MFNFYCWRCFASALYLRWRRLLEMGLFRRVAFWWTGVVLFGGGEGILFFKMGSRYRILNVVSPQRCFASVLYLRQCCLLEMGLFRRVVFWRTGVVLFRGGEWILFFK
jgi:hypothetical protein